MKNWMKVHQALAVALFLLIVVQILIYVFVIGPRKEELSEVKDSIASQMSRLKGAEYSLDAEKLKAYLERLKKELEGKSGTGIAIRANSEEALKKAGETFLPQIIRDYGKVSDFIQNVSRLDYQSEYNRIVLDWAGKGVKLSPEILNLSEDTQTPYTYQIMLSIWTVDKLLSLAGESKLAVAEDNSFAKRRGKGGNTSHAMVTVKTMKAYFASPKDEKPYLLEFPVQITLKGELNSCLDFLERLNGEGVFLPARSFEIFAEPPAKIVSNQQGKIESGQLRMKLECSSFLVPTF